MTDTKQEPKITRSMSREQRRRRMVRMAHVAVHIIAEEIPLLDTELELFNLVESLTELRGLAQIRLAEVRQEYMDANDPPKEEE